MAKKQSKSARIRKMLEQGKSVKQIAATLQCSPQLVYQARADLKKKALILTGKTIQRWKKEQENAMNAVPYTMTEVHKDLFQPKPTMWARFKSWLVA